MRPGELAEAAPGDTERGGEPAGLPTPSPATLTQRRILRSWWPLAASWLLMGAELPALAAVVARLPDQQTHLGAWGGIVFPVALLIEAPIIMMLAASTALSRDLASYRLLERFANAAGLLLSLLHALVAFTPLYDLLVVAAINPPPELIEPGRLGLMIMTPWSWAIADRRFQQGALIRFGRSRAVGLGTAARMCVTASTLAVCYLLRLPGVAVAATAITVGVLAEMLVARAAVRPIRRREISAAPPIARTLTVSRILSFYLPLALTPLFMLASQPIGAAAISRMPLSIIALASWPVVNGLIFVLRAPGIAFNEVVVSLAEEPGASAELARFSQRLALATTLVLLLFILTPLSLFWFDTLSALEPALIDLSVGALPLALLLPATAVWQSHYHGLLVAAHRTRGVTESVAVFLLLTAGVLFVGVQLQRWNGLEVTLVALSAGQVGAAVWSRWRWNLWRPR
jgi:hypothetical protein